MNTLNNMFVGIFDDSLIQVVSLEKFLITMVSSLIIGFMISWVYGFKSRYSKNFIRTLAIMPAMVCMVIMMVNGNVGAGVAVAGAFSLVRFRSLPGTSTEIAEIFLAMVSGIILGMGYIAYAFLFAIVICIIKLIYIQLGYGTKKYERFDRTLRITIPEDLNYTHVFEDLFKAYTSQIELINVRTGDMGSLYRLTYNLSLSNPSKEKEFIDELRCRNGNLEILMAKQENFSNEL